MLFSHEMPQPTEKQPIQTFSFPETVIPTEANLPQSAIDLFHRVQQAFITQGQPEISLAHSSLGLPTRRFVAFTEQEQQESLKGKWVEGTKEEIIQGKTASEENSIQRKPVRGIVVSQKGDTVDIFEPPDDIHYPGTHDLLPMQGGNTSYRVPQKNVHEGTIPQKKKGYAQEIKEMVESHGQKDHKT